MTKPTVSVYASISKNKNMVIKYCLYLSYINNFGKEYSKIIFEGVRNSSRRRVQLFIIRKTLEQIKIPSIINFYFLQTININKFNDYFKNQNIRPNNDIFNEIFSMSQQHDIMFFNIDENNKYIQICTKKILDIPTLIIEDEYKSRKHKTVEIFEKFFKNSLKINTTFDLSILEYIILIFVLKHNSIYSAFTISNILIGSKSKYLSDNIKRHEQYYGILKNIYSRRNILISISNLIHKTKLLSEVSKPYSSNFETSDYWTAVELKSNLPSNLLTQLSEIEKIITNTFINNQP